MKRCIDWIQLWTKNVQCVDISQKDKSVGGYTVSYILHSHQHSRRTLNMLNVDLGRNRTHNPPPARGLQKLRLDAVPAVKPLCYRSRSSPTMPMPLQLTPYGSPTTCPNGTPPPFIQKYSSHEFKTHRTLFKTQYSFSTTYVTFLLCTAQSNFRYPVNCNWVR